MAEIAVLRVSELPPGAKKVIQVGETAILLINLDDEIVALQAECPHAGAPLVEGAICNRRLVCPWHLGTFALPAGEVLEPPAMTSLKRYASRREGGQILVNPEPLPEKRRSALKIDEQPVFLLIGMGAAGAMAAITLREGGFPGRILAIDPARDEPVDRTQLSKDGLGGKVPLDQLSLNDFSDIQVERLYASVTKLNSIKRQVELDNGTEINFDKALVATGGKPDRLHIPGAELAYTIRHVDDVRNIHKVAHAGKAVGIVGTSFIALEAASALVHKGLSVTVMGRETLPFEKQFGSEVAQMLTNLHLEKGTKFRLGVEIMKISKGAVTILDAGKEDEIQTDLVILGVGVSPDLGFEHDLPIAQGGGLQVDDDLRVAQSVWGAGDIASVAGQRIEHWRVAQQHGRLAAFGMMGDAASYQGVPFFWTYHFGKRMGYLGRAVTWDRVHIKGDLNGGEFMVFYVKNGEVAAVLNCGFETEMALLSEPIRKKLTLHEAIGLVG